MGVLVLTLVILGGIAFGLMQLSPVKSYVAGEIEERFNSRFNGVLNIGNIEGMIPFLIIFNDLKVYPDSSSYKPVVEVEEVSANLDVLQLFRNRLVLNGLKLVNPQVTYDHTSSASIHAAITAENNSTVETSQFLNTLAQYQILIPSFELINGQVILLNTGENEFNPEGDSLHIQDVNLNMYFEFNEEQRFIDIASMNFNIPGLDVESGNLSGQIYNDEQYLELNALKLTIDENQIRFSGEADGVNLLQEDIPTQILASNLTAIFDQASFDEMLLSKLFPEAEILPASIHSSFSAHGTLDFLNFENLQLSSGESYLSGYGHITNITEISEADFNLHLDYAVFDEELLDLLPVQWNYEQKRVLTQSRLSGEISGNTGRLFADVELSSPAGNLQLKGEMGIAQEPTIDVAFRTDSLDISSLTALNEESILTLEGRFRSTSFDFRNSMGGLTVSGRQGHIGPVQFDNVQVLASWEDGLIEPNIDIDISGSGIETYGWIDLKNEVPEFYFSGNAQNLELNRWLNISGLSPAIVDIHYEMNMSGNPAGNLSGQMSLDVNQAIVNGDTLGHHQLYFDINSPDSESRSLRFTSTAFDATLTGNYNPAGLTDIAQYWFTYFKNQTKQEFFGQTTDSLHINRELALQNLVLEGRVKDTGLIHAYFPDFPQFSSGLRVQSTINAGPERLLINGSIQDPNFTAGESYIDSLIIQMTGNFRYGYPLKETARLQIQADIAEAEFEFLDARDFTLYAEFDRDSIFIRNSMAEFAGNRDFNIQTTGSLNDESLKFLINEFSFGENEYTWTHHQDAAIEYFFDERLRFRNFAFSNLDQYIRIEGTFSSALTDSVNYEIGGVDLSRISRIIEGRVSFDGELNGIFTTRTLTTVPAIQGNINIEHFRIDGNTIGDIALNSSYNPDLHRFDTRIEVQTDSVKYPSYFDNTGRKGQNFDISGYVLAPRDGEFPDTDSLFVFDIDFNNIDMWILPYISPKIFVEGSGLAAGTGKIWGNLDDYDFRADFMVGTEDAVYFRPRFLETYYYAQGPITFTRERGLEFNDIFLVDPSGGTAILNGYYNFNDFQPIHFMDIKLDMEEFQFLNSGFDPTAPFYGTAYGTSTVTISGTNMNPVLASERPIVLSDFSEIGIPLMEETEFNEDNRFIRFVDSFDQNPDSTQNVNGRGTFIPNPEPVDPVDLTFAERFTLDLQFEANDPMTVQLIFDPVTGDIVTADGTGRMRIRLEDEEVSMFGRFNITGGRYQFVSGDIFSRRFELESGGSIIWEGDPANARLNLNAIYRARPDINTLSAISENPEDATRVPVELVLNIAGTISAIENNFFFRLPVTFESRQSTTLSTQLAALNRDEELKLIQSANFLLVGEFIPISTSAGTQWFSENLSGSAAVLNPLISSQVIRPLLSNQINSLLNSDVSTVDVEFNLNTYNEIDLGVALRLYNDRLIIRREGQITGSQSNIGDLGATYRINRIFAVTAFHRQDLTFGTLPSAEQSQQAQEINGVGIEANLSFNNWREFFKRLTTPFRKLFGVKENEHQENLTQNNQVQVTG